MYYKQIFNQVLHPRAQQTMQDRSDGARGIPKIPGQPWPCLQPEGSDVVGLEHAGGRDGQLDGGGRMWLPATWRFWYAARTQEVWPP